MIYFVTAADNAYYARVIGLIGSIIQNVKQPYSIALYDLGLTESNIAYLSRIPAVTIKQVEKVNAYITQPYLKHKHHHSKVIGCYTWKPVCVKQELDLHDAIFWIDAGTNVIRDFAPLWQHTLNTGHFFSGINDIGWQCTRYVIDKLQLSQEVINAQALCSAYMGITRSLYESFVLPAYHDAKDVNLFFDDGTALGGKTTGRHDQTIFSIRAKLAGLRVEPNSRSLMLQVDTGIAEYNITDVKRELNSRTIIYHSRGNMDYNFYKRITDKAIL